MQEYIWVKNTLRKRYGNVFFSYLLALILTGLVGADWIFLLSFSILLTNLIRDGCRVKFCFPLEGKRFFEHCSLEAMESEIGGERVVEVVSSFVSKKTAKKPPENQYISYADSVIKSSYLSLAYNYWLLARCSVWAHLRCKMTDTHPEYLARLRVLSIWTLVFYLSPPSHELSW